jgi:Flp pilus assembly protein TadB
VSVEPVPGADLPRSVRRGPRITLTCRCGERQYVNYGELWTCEKCGRRWNTLRIPVEQYAAIRRTQLRYRRVPMVISLLAMACIVVFIALGKAFGGLILVAFGATAWSMFVRPMHKRRYRRALAELPSWEIEPD